MQAAEKMIETFIKKARAVSAVVSEVKTLQEAFRYAAELCRRKEPCRPLIPGGESPRAAPGQDSGDAKTRKVIAAPGLDPEQLEEFEILCRNGGFILIADGLRDHLGGIDIGFTVVDYGIAETGSLVLNSRSENVRLATMISEIHVALLDKSRIRENSYALESELKRFMQFPADYTAFITGASRTADIERVLALGVHGPLELHILLREG